MEEPNPQESCTPTQPRRRKVSQCEMGMIGCCFRELYSCLFRAHSTRAAFKHRSPLDSPLRLLSTHDPPPSSLSSNDGFHDCVRPGSRMDGPGDDQNSTEFGWFVPGSRSPLFWHLLRRFLILGLLEAGRCFSPFELLSQPFLKVPCEDKMGLLLVRGPRGPQDCSPLFHCRLDKRNSFTEKCALRS